MATIRDVAKAAGVSAAAVSRILNNDPSLSTSIDTKERVLKAAKDLDYSKKKINTMNCNSTIGILQWFSSQREIEDNYYLLIRQGIEDYCTKNKINIVRSFKSDINYMTSLTSADGIVCIGKFCSQEIKDLKALSKNIVFLDITIDDTESTTVSLDFTHAVKELLSLLLSKGHKKIGYLGGIETLEDGSVFEDPRKSAFIDYCNEHNLCFKNYLKEDSFSGESGYSMMKEMIDSGDMPTAIFAASDSVAIGAMRALLDNGFTIPTDVAIIGFNNTSVSGYTNPPLTTVTAPSYAMGQYGAGIVNEMIHSKLPSPMKIKLPCNIEIRESV